MHLFEDRSVRVLDLFAGRDWRASHEHVQEDLAV